MSDPFDAYADDPRIRYVHKLDSGQVFQVDLTNGQNVAQAHGDLWIHQVPEPGTFGYVRATQARYGSLGEALAEVLGPARGGAR